RPRGQEAGDEPPRYAGHRAKAVAWPRGGGQAPALRRIARRGGRVVKRRGTSPRATPETVPAVPVTDGVGNFHRGHVYAVMRVACAV
ncbi:MAG: hypothetical protein OXE05_10250, partial [Chloroflexi bacterium]|nr:hypothetical protein [Chloroflexota bacterium]